MVSLVDPSAVPQPDLARPAGQTQSLEWQQDISLPLLPDRNTAASSEVTLGRPLPAVVTEFLQGAGLDWYNISVVLDDAKVDPFYRKLAERLPEGQLVIGGGSDLVQIVMGLSKQILAGADSVNTTMPARVLQNPEKTYLQFDEVQAPAFGDRKEELTLTVLVNGESSSNLKQMIENTLSDKPLAESDLGNLMVPLKHGYLAVVSAEGPVTLFFRTELDYQAYKQKLITLPEASDLNVDDWIKSIPEPMLKDAALNTLQYCAIVYERGQDSGWCFDPFSHAFLRELSARLNGERMEEVRAFVREVFTETGLKPKHLEETFDYIGLTRPSMRGLSYGQEAA